MYVKSLKIKNFRGLQTATLTFDSHITVIVGVNGVGKTSILDALAWQLSQVLRIFPKIGYLNVSSVKKSDIREGKSTSEVEISLSLGKNIDDIISKNSIHPSVTRTNTLLPNENTIQSWNIEEKVTQVPLVVYYRQSRGFENIQRNAKRQTAEIILKGSTDPQLGAITNLESWWDDIDADESGIVRDTRNLDYRDIQLEAVRNLVKEIDGFSNIKFHRKKDLKGLYIEKDGLDVHIGSLSSGERAYLLLLADLARRLQVVSPDKKMNEIQGIVLIDEIELNLHPAWQGKIVHALRDVFSGCQFIITTHSPMILSGVEAEHIRVMSIAANGEAKFSRAKNTRGRTSNFLLEGVFGATERLSEADELIKRFNNAIDKKDVLFAEKLIKKISNLIEGDAPELLVFRKRLERLKG